MTIKSIAEIELGLWVMDYQGTGSTNYFGRSGRLMGQCVVRNLCCAVN